MKWPLISGCLWLCALGGAAQAQDRIFKLRCELRGVIPALEDKALKPAQVEVDIQAIGVNLFLTLRGPKPYDMYISTLTTEKFTAKNTTDGTAMGIQSRDNEDGTEREVRITRGSLAINGSTDMRYRRQRVKLVFEGECQRAR